MINLMINLYHLFLDTILYNKFLDNGIFLIILYDFI